MSASQLTCSFCTKPVNQVEKLIAGPSVYICNECVELCDGIMYEDEFDVPRLTRRVMSVLGEDATLTALMEAARNSTASEVAPLSELVAVVISGRVGLLRSKKREKLTALARELEEKLEDPNWPPDPNPEKTKQILESQTRKGFRRTNFLEERRSVQYNKLRSCRMALEKLEE